jgi:hypothetical protein
LANARFTAACPAEGQGGTEDAEFYQYFVMVNVLLNKPTPPSLRHTATEITENSIENFVFFVSSCESDVQDLDDHYSSINISLHSQRLGGEVV